MGVITTARYYLILLSSSEAGVSCILMYAKSFLPASFRLAPKR